MHSRTTAYAVGCNDRRQIAGYGWIGTEVNSQRSRGGGADRAYRAVVHDDNVVGGCGRIKTETIDGYRSRVGSDGG